VFKVDRWNNHIAVRGSEGQEDCERREGLMERVAEIYDLLSNSIENGGQVIRMAG